MLKGMTTLFLTFFEIRINHTNLTELIGRTENAIPEALFHSLLDSFTTFYINCCVLKQFVEKTFH